MNNRERMYAALVVVLGIGMGLAAWKMFEFRGDLQAIKDNMRWEAWLKQSGAYEHRPTVLFGDSNIANWPMAESFGVLPVINRGVPGDWAASAVDRFQRDVIDQDPQTVVLLLGTNDLGNAQPIDSIVQHIDRMVGQARQAGIDVVVLSLPPVRGEYEANHPARHLREINARLQTLATTHGAQFMDVFSMLAGDDGAIRHDFTTDGLHINQAGYVRMTLALVPVISP